MTLTPTGHKRVVKEKVIEMRLKEGEKNLIVACEAEKKTKEFHNKIQLKAQGRGFHVLF